MRLQAWGRKIGRGLIRLLAHLLCIYACLALTLNSMWSGAILTLQSIQYFGSIHWERLSWGPKPWDLRAKLFV